MMDAIFYILYVVLFVYAVFINIIDRWLEKRKWITITIRVGSGQVMPLKGDVLRMGSTGKQAIVTKVEEDNGSFIVTTKIKHEN